MSTRKLVRKVNVKAIEENKVISFELEYYTLAKETSVDSASALTYGIEVLKKSLSSEKTFKIEYRKIFDIFCTEAEAQDAALVLARNTVTPISVSDIIEQFIGTNEFSYEEYELCAI